MENYIDLRTHALENLERIINEINGGKRDTSEKICYAIAELLDELNEMQFSS